MNNSLRKLYRCFNEDDFQSLILETRNYLLNFINEISVQIHPLGFYVLKLGQIDDDLNIRLHIWNNKLTPQNLELMVHNHIFDMKSFVLKGEIINKEYELICDENKVTKNQLYKVNYSNNNSILIKSESNFTLLETKQSTIKKGHSYKIDAGVFHESIVQNPYTATLLITKLAKIKNPTVVAKCDLGNEISFNRKIPNDKLLYEIVEEFFMETFTMP